MKNLALSSLSAVILLFTNLASASLNIISSAGDVVIYDDVTNQAWVAEMNETSVFYNKNYIDQLAIVSTMNAPGTSFGGLRGWRIATENDLMNLLQNPLEDIVSNFWFKVSGSTNGIAGRYENNINPPAENKHHAFHVFELKCCEPFETGRYPYEQLIQSPGPNDDVFYYATPVPTTGQEVLAQMPDTTYGLVAWVVNSNVLLSDGRLIHNPCTTIFGKTFCYARLFNLYIAAILITSLGAWIWLYRRKKKS